MDAWSSFRICSRCSGLQSGLQAADHALNTQPIMTRDTGCREHWQYSDTWISDAQPALPQESYLWYSVLAVNKDSRHATYSVQHSLASRSGAEATSRMPAARAAKMAC